MRLLYGFELHGLVDLFSANFAILPVWCVCGDQIMKLHDIILSVLVVYVAS